MAQEVIRKILTDACNFKQLTKQSKLREYKAILTRK